MELDRYRFSYPKGDVTVVKWMQAQVNISHSLRQIIKDYVEENGFTDATCKPVVQKARPGRPTAQMQRLKQMEEMAEAEEMRAVQPEPVQIAVPMPSPRPKQVTHTPVINPVVQAPVVDASAAEDGFMDPDSLLGFR